jgi:small redox-active disulfide protein 2
MRIEILGAGCAGCKAVEKHVHKAVESLGLDAEIVKVDDIEEIVKRGIMTPPAVIIDGKVVVTGCVVSTEKMKELLQR